jgi:hypothetical protein
MVLPDLLVRQTLSRRTLLLHGARGEFLSYTTYVSRNLRGVRGAYNMVSKRTPRFGHHPKKENEI